MAGQGDQEGAENRCMGASDSEAALLSGVPGEEVGRELVFDFKWMNSFCVKSKVKMETPKKLRRMVEPNNWCFIFDLQDGYHAMGVDPDFQNIMQFDLQGQFQCTALLFGWADPEDLRQVYEGGGPVLVRCSRGLSRAAEAREQVGRDTLLRSTDDGELEVCIKTYGVGGHPYMDEFLILTSTEEKAFEPEQPFEHLGLEVDLKEGLLRVTEKQINKIHAQAKNIICDATQEKRWLPARRLADFNGLLGCASRSPSRCQLRGCTFTSYCKFRVENQAELGSEGETAATDLLEGAPRAPRSPRKLPGASGSGLEEFHFIKNSDEQYLVHGDIKPANIVKFSLDDVWKIIDMATASQIDEDATVEYTLRYAAPEVVKLALQGQKTAPRSPASDMWSAGVVMYEVYSGQRLFDESMSDQQVVAELLSSVPMQLKGLQNMEAGAARLIRDKLLVKDPAERWSVDKVLHSNFFKTMDDTTRMSSSSVELSQSIRRLSGEIIVVLILLPFNHNRIQK
ncbi:hypothetical protein CYMTET_38160 [Cymbomonas tetramitiformis]|uniref:Protein kinase domain-containing protein n=1 Tax=Cymbomonas tetramitiformis TaxID=36881 RepID=A0AAE0F5Y6_9CHLO|nr:hypothetical protein CYMTET_38160 [Cymbomonas tetramitiformis]